MVRHGRQHRRQDFRTRIGTPSQGLCGSTVTAAEPKIGDGPHAQRRIVGAGLTTRPFPSIAPTFEAGRSPSWPIPAGRVRRPAPTGPNAKSSDGPHAKRRIVGGGSNDPPFSVYRTD